MTLSEASELSPGDYLYAINGEPVTIDSVVATKKPLSVFNITVENAHTYFVGGLGVLNHNAGKTCKYKGIVWGKEKDPIDANDKHVPGRPGYNRSAGTLPSDADAVYRANAVYDGKYWWGKGRGDALYRYCNNGNGVFHWCGSTKDPENPLGRDRVNNVEILKHFGIKLKGGL